MSECLCILEPLQQIEKLWIACGIFFAFFAKFLSLNNLLNAYSDSESNEIAHKLNENIKKFSDKMNNQY